MVEFIRHHAVWSSDATSFVMDVHSNIYLQSWSGIVSGTVSIVMVTHLAKMLAHGDGA